MLQHTFDGHRFAIAIPSAQTQSSRRHARWQISSSFDNIIVHGFDAVTAVHTQEQASVTAGCEAVLLLTCALW